MGIELPFKVLNGREVRIVADKTNNISIDSSNNAGITTLTNDRRNDVIAFQSDEKSPQLTLNLSGASNSVTLLNAGNLAASVETVSSGHNNSNALSYSKTASDNHFSETGNNNTDTIVGSLSGNDAFLITGNHAVVSYDDATLDEKAVVGNPDEKKSPLKTKMTLDILGSENNVNVQSIKHNLFSLINGSNNQTVINCTNGQNEVVVGGRENSVTIHGGNDTVTLDLKGNGWQLESSEQPSSLDNPVTYQNVDTDSFVHIMHGKLIHKVNYLPAPQESR